MLNHPFSSLLGDTPEIERALLYDIISAANASVTVNELATYCLDALTTLIPSKFGSFFVFKTEPPTLHIEYARMVPPALRRELEAISPEQSAPADGGDLYALDPILAHMRLVLAEHQAPAPILIPLTAGNALYGLVVIAVETHPEVDAAWENLEAHREFLSQVGAHVGMALKRFAAEKTAQAALERRNRALPLFHEFILATQDPTDLTAAIEKGVTLVKEWTNARAVAVFRRKPGEPGYMLESHRDALDIDTATQWLNSLPEPLRTQAWHDLDHQVDEPVREPAGLLVPIQHGGQGYGAIVVLAGEEDAFRQEDVRLLENVAAQLANALHHQALVANLHQQVRQFEAVVKTGQLIESSTEVRESLSRVARELGQVLGASYTVLHVLKNDRFEYVAASDTRERDGAFPVAAYEQRLLASPDPLLVRDRDDDTVDPDQRAILIKLNMRASFGIRLFTQNRPIGLLFVNQAEARNWQPHERRLISAFAQQIAHALQNKLLLDETNQQVRELRALAKVGRLIATANPPDRALYGCADEIARVFGADYVGFHLRDGNMMRLVAESQETRAAHLLPILPHQYRILEELDPIRVSDYRKDAAHPQQFAFLEKYNLVADLGVPLVAGQKALGILYISQHTPREWTDAQVQLAETFAQQVAGALTNTRLLRETQAQVRDLRALAHSTNLIARSRSPEHALPNAAEDLRRLLIADYVGFHLREGNNFRVVTESHHPHANRRYPIQPYHNVLLEHFQTIITRDRERDARDPVYRDALVRLGFEADVAAPMVSRGRTIGILFVSQKVPRDWLPAEVNLIQTYAHQIAIVLELVQLLSEKEARVRELAQLTDLQTLTATLLDEEILVEMALGGMQNFMNADRITLTLVHEGRLGIPRNLDDSAYPEEPTLRPDQLETLIGARHPVVIGSARAQPGDRLQTHVKAPQAKSFLAVPLVEELKTIAILGFAFSTNRNFEQHEIGLAQAVAHQVAVALSNTRLVREQSQRIRQLNELAQFSMWCGTVHDTETLKAEATFRIHHMLGKQATSIRLVVDGMLEPGAGEGYKYTEARNQPLAITPRLYRVLELKQPFPIENLADDPTASTEWRDRHFQEGFQSLLMLPMVAQGSVIGILSLFGAHPHQWQDHEIQYAQTLANTVALALSNVRQIEVAKQKTDELEATLDSVFSGVFRTDDQGVIVSWNRAAQEITGLTEADMLNKAWHIDGPRIGTARRADEIVRLAIVENQVQFGNAPRFFTRADGTIIQLRVAAAPLRDSMSNARGAVCSFWDRSNEKENERARVDFINLVGHQLNSKLGAMIWSAEQLRESSLSAASRKRLIEIISATRKELIPFNRRLDALQADHGVDPFETSTVELHSVVRRKVAEWRAIQADRQIEMRGKFPTVCGDDMSLDVVLDNLLENACKYSPRDSRITLRGRTEGTDRVKLTIHNWGKPIPPELVPLLFDRWQRGDSKKPGSGLGLWLVRTKLHEIEGQVQVKSTIKQGTSFIVTLRAALPAPEVPS